MIKTQQELFKIDTVVFKHNYRMTIEELYSNARKHRKYKVLKMIDIELLLLCFKFNIISVYEVMELLDVSRVAVIKRVNKLIDLGLLKKVETDLRFQRHVYTLSTSANSLVGYDKIKSLSPNKVFYSTKYAHDLKLMSIYHTIVKPILAKYDLSINNIMSDRETRLHFKGFKFVYEDIMENDKVKDFLKYINFYNQVLVDDNFYQLIQLRKDTKSYSKALFMPYPDLYIYDNEKDISITVELELNIKEKRRYEKKFASAKYKTLSSTKTIWVIPKEKKRIGNTIKPILEKHNYNYEIIYY